MQSTLWNIEEEKKDDIIKCWFSQKSVKKKKPLKFQSKMFPDQRKEILQNQQPSNLNFSNISTKRKPLKIIKIYKNNKITKHCQNSVKS